MEFDDVLRRRKMTRRFRNEPLPSAVLDTILRAGTRAPSAGFSQGVDLLVLTDDTARARFWQAASDDAWRDRDQSSRGLVAAPAIVVPIADPDAYAARYAEADKSETLLFDRPAASWPTPFWLVDTSFAAMAMLLCATDQGVGALFFQLHNDEDSFKAALRVPASRRLIGALALGYAAGGEVPTSPSRRARRPLDEVVHRQEW